MDPQARYDAQGNPIPDAPAQAPPASAPIRYDAQGNEIHPDDASAPLHSPITEAIEHLSRGALKATGRTALNLATTAAWLMGVKNATDPTTQLLKQAIGEPQGGWEKAGALAADMATALLPAGAINRASQAAEAAVGGGRLAQAAARAVVQGAAGAGTSAVQGGSPVAGAVTGGIVGALTPTAPAIEESANKSMIRALGPPGGRGPTGERNLAAAEEIAPSLVKKGFMPLTHAQAATQAKAAVQDAGDALKDVLSTEGAATFDQPSLLSRIKEMRTALMNNPGGGAKPFLPVGDVSKDTFLRELQADVESLGAKPTAQAVHRLKQTWNSVINWSDTTANVKSDVYDKGGDLIRAMLSGDHAKISAADQAFHRASLLEQIVTAPTARRPNAGIREVVMPLARPAVGATLGAYQGYREGGIGGAIVGGTAGAALGKLINSQGFQFISAAMKHKLAEALTKNSANVSQLIASLTAQATSLAPKSQEPD